MELKDAIVVITGATKGLGKALARTAKEGGARVVISAREEKEVRRVAEELGVEGIAADVSREKEMQMLSAAVVEKFGTIDVWINNAGIWIPWQNVEEMPIDKVRQMVEVNLFGTIYGSRCAAIQMKKQKKGTIVNVISTTALNGRAGSSGYAASKAALIGFSRSIRKELSPAGIKVLSVYPGGMKTDIFGEHPVPGYETFMDPVLVARAMWKNVVKIQPEEELILENEKDVQKV